MKNNQHVDNFNYLLEPININDNINDEYSHNQPKENGESIRRSTRNKRAPNF